MGAIAVVMRGQFRQRWASWLVLALLVGLVSGLAMAAAVAARRTESAFPRFLAAHGYDAVLYTDAPLPGLARSPQVASVTPVGSVPNGPVTCTCTHPVGSNFALLEVPAPSLGQVTKLVAGRRPYIFPY